ncbi:unnamed protein product [Amoebophrya sp. A120]|nr:unnamed protein product [Amoebophrya sp. A120]|eukprot:GSA120T00012619001.1
MTKQKMLLPLLLFLSVTCWHSLARANTKDFLARRANGNDGTNDPVPGDATAVKEDAGGDHLHAHDEPNLVHDGTNDIYGDREREHESSSPFQFLEDLQNSEQPSDIATADGAGSPSSFLGSFASRFNSVFRFQREDDAVGGKKEQADHDKNAPAPAAAARAEIKKMTTGQHHDDTFAAAMTSNDMNPTFLEREATGTAKPSTSFTPSAGDAEEVASGDKKSAMKNEVDAERTEPLKHEDEGNTAGEDAAAEERPQPKRGNLRGSGSGPDLPLRDASSAASSMLSSSTSSTPWAEAGEGATAAAASFSEHGLGDHVDALRPADGNENGGAPKEAGDADEDAHSGNVEAFLESGQGHASAAGETQTKDYYSSLSRTGEGRSTSELADSVGDKQESSSAGAFLQEESLNALLSPRHNPQGVVRSYSAPGPFPGGGAPTTSMTLQTPRPMHAAGTSPPRLGPSGGQVQDISPEEYARIARQNAATNGGQYTYNTWNGKTQKWETHTAAVAKNAQQMLRAEEEIKKINADSSVDTARTSPPRRFAWRAEDFDFGRRPDQVHGLAPSRSFSVDDSMLPARGRATSTQHAATAPGALRQQPGGPQVMQRSSSSSSSTSAQFSAPPQPAGPAQFPRSRSSQALAANHAAAQERELERDIGEPTASPPPAPGRGQQAFTTAAQAISSRISSTSSQISSAIGFGTKRFSKMADPNPPPRAPADTHDYCKKTIGGVHQSPEQIHYCQMYLRYRFTQYPDPSKPGGMGVGLKRSAPNGPLSMQTHILPDVVQAFGANFNAFSPAGKWQCQEGAGCSAKTECCYCRCDNPNSENKYQCSWQPCPAVNGRKKAYFFGPGSGFLKTAWQVDIYGVGHQDYQVLHDTRGMIAGPGHNTGYDDIPDTRLGLIAPSQWAGAEGPGNSGGTFYEFIAHCYGFPPVLHKLVTDHNIRAIMSGSRGGDFAKEMRKHYLRVPMVNFNGGMLLEHQHGQFVPKFDDAVPAKTAPPVLVLVGAKEDYQAFQPVSVNPPPALLQKASTHNIALVQSTQGNHHNPGLNDKCLRQLFKKTADGVSLDGGSLQAAECGLPCPSPDPRIPCSFQILANFRDGR